MKRFLSLVAILLSTIVLFTGCGSNSNSGNIQVSGNGNEGVFRVGLEAGYAPFNWTQMDDSNGGVRIEGRSGCRWL